MDSILQRYADRTLREVFTDQWQQQPLVSIHDPCLA